MISNRETTATMSRDRVKARSSANGLPRRDGRGKPNGCWPASCSDMGLPRRDDLVHGAGRRKDATGNPKVLRLGDKG